ncbi:MAG: 3'(2'),5'-bisphosphate nucleotidase CysQ [Spirochaetaceae bacterium]|nr:MAG: 3'(2'),5'-bisphosphate nucleotidase CysQ [Spirochaetaceae bacterium]
MRPMLDVHAIEELLPSLVRIAVDAGVAIREVYDSDDFQTERKADNSPLTRADTRAHRVIDAGLRALTPDLPVLSEEGRLAPYSERRDWQQFWMVDPLDGTKEFIRRTDEFTVNIALIQDAEPVCGVVYAPIPRIVWAGIVGVGAWKMAVGGDTTPGGGFGAPGGDPSPDGATTPGGGASLAGDATPGGFDVAAAGTPIRVATRDDSSVRVVASRTHMNAETRDFIDRIRDDFDTVDLLNAGSSLKLCLIAEGRADIYPRHAPTSEWDTAAGHAVIRAAGGEIYQAGPDAELAAGAAAGAGAGAGGPVDGGGDAATRVSASGEEPQPAPLRYNKENLLNPWFVVRAW